jgi:hypothetical protein
MASAARDRAADARWLPTRLTARNTNHTIECCGSAIVSVPNGGRKKKFRTSAAATDAGTATRRVATAEMQSTASSSSSATTVVVAIPRWYHCCRTNTDRARMVHEPRGLRGTLKCFHR